jgi:hypothetical protein
MDGTEGRRRGFVAEAQQLLDCFNQVEAATESIFLVLLLAGPRQGLGSSLTAVGGFGVVAAVIIAIVRWIPARRCHGRGAPNGGYQRRAAFRDHLQN